MKIEYLITKNPILTDILDIPDGITKKCIDRVYEIGDEMNNTTNLKADMSSYSLHLKDVTFVPILEKITDLIWKSYPLDLFINFEYYKKEDGFLKVQDFWSGIYKKGDYAIKHSHVPSFLSFCFYLQADEYSSPLRFDDADYEIIPEKNKLIVFPSWIQHSVVKQSNLGVDRIILSGNIYLMKRHF